MMVRKVTTKRKPRAKAVAKEESSWFNKSVFWAMFVVMVCSVVTACSMITQTGISDILPRDTVPTDEGTVIISPIITDRPDGHIHLEKNIGQALLNSHILQHHQLDSNEILMKCSDLNGKIYTCQLVKSPEVTPIPQKKTEKSVVIKKKVVVEKDVEPEFIDEEELSKPRKKWNPFK